VASGVIHSEGGALQFHDRRPAKPGRFVDFRPEVASMNRTRAAHRRRRYFQSGSEIAVQDRFIDLRSQSPHKLVAAHTAVIKTRTPSTCTPSSMCPQSWNAGSKRHSSGSEGHKPLGGASSRPKRQSRCSASRSRRALRRSEPGVARRRQDRHLGVPSVRSTRRRSHRRRVEDHRSLRSRPTPARIRARPFLASVRPKVSRVSSSLFEAMGLSEVELQ